MNPIDALVAEQACRNLMAALVHAQDHGDGEAAAALFAADGVWFRSGKPHAGRDAIVASFAGREPADIIRHVASNQRVTIVSPNEATGISYYLVYLGRASGEEATVGALQEPVVLGEWHDRFVLTAEGWRFAERWGERVLQR